MHITFTNREASLMDVLWDHGAATVAEVKALLRDDLAYTTVLTILRTLEAKGYVGHEEDGRAHRYTALVGRDLARRSALQDLSDKLFKGSTSLLLTHLVSDQKLSAADVKRIRALIAGAGKKPRS